MPIRLATTEDDLHRVWPVMQQLRPNLPDAATFIATVQRMQRRHGYEIAMLDDHGEVVAVAGFRIDEMLFRGRYLYVDDLVTDAEARSSGHGKTLLDWLRARARADGCTQLALDSGNHRTDAHRFYQREGMEPFATHFVEVLA